jgi:hypothetical protein
LAADLATPRHDVMADETSANVKLRITIMITTAIAVAINPYSQPLAAFSLRRMLTMRSTMVRAQRALAGCHHLHLQTTACRQINSIHGKAEYAAHALLLVNA